MTQPVGKRRSPALATLLSFVFPGLGHAYLGRRRSALLYAVPVLGVLLLIAFRAISDGPEILALEMFTPSTALTVLGIIVVLGLWWIIAMAEAFNAAGGRRPLRPLPGALIAVLALSITGVTSYGAYNAWNLYAAGLKIFQGTGPDANLGSTPDPSATDQGAGASGSLEPTDPPFADATPMTTPRPGSTRITVLLTGLDSSPTRNHALNDTMIVVSLDTATGSLSMVSFARDIAGFKMWDGSTFPGKINSLMTVAARDPARYPLGGINTLIKELSFLIGIPIDYYAVVNLPGFTALVDAAGGVTVHNDTVIADPTYGGWTDKRPIGFSLGVGTFTLDGQRALAFARSRMGPANNDFVRARRQQLLILALEKKLSSPSMIPRLAGIIQALGNTVRTNYPADGLGAALDAAKKVDDAHTTREVLGPPFAVRSTDPSTYSLTLDMAKIAALSISLYGPDSAYYVAPAPTPSPSGP